MQTLLHALTIEEFASLPPEEKLAYLEAMFQAAKAESDRSDRCPEDAVPLPPTRPH
jgi:hypothetical protein